MKSWREVEKGSEKKAGRTVKKRPSGSYKSEGET